MHDPFPVLQAAVAAKGPYQSLPSEMVASKGRLMLEFVELFSGKAVPNKVRTLQRSHACNTSLWTQLLHTGSVHG